MRRTWIFISAIMVLSSCVSRSRYDQVVSSINSKTKQKAKLEKQVDALKQENETLRDSAERI